MIIENITVEETLKNVAIRIIEDKGWSYATMSLFEVLILIITLLANRLNLNRKNSSKPPSTDQNREKTSKTKSKGKQGRLKRTKL